MPIAPTPSPTRRLPGHHPWRRVLAFLAPHRGSVIAITALTLTGSALCAVEPLLLRTIFDAVGAGVKQPLLHGVLMLVIVGALREAIGAGANWLSWRTRVRIHYDLLSATVGRLQLLPVSFHRREGVGAAMTRLERGIQGLVSAITDITLHGLPAAVYLLVSLGIMVRLDLRLALVVAVFAPLPAIVMAIVAPLQTRRERNLLDRWARIYARFSEVLSGIVTVKSFAMEDAEKGRFLSDVEAANQVVIRGVGLDSGVSAGQNMVVVIARVAALLAGGLLALEGRITLGMLAAFLGYVTGLFGPVQGLTGIYRTIQTARVSIDTVLGILDADDHVADVPDAKEVHAVRGDVRFQAVRFGYLAGQAPVLSGLDFSVCAGETVAIVGPSGSGKSTLMALLQRLYDPDEGAVLLDGEDLRGLRQRSLRRQIGVVLQDALLFNDTVHDNITYGRPGAPRRDVEAAAHAANAHDFVMRMPRGYESLVGERGNLLSAGERQRLAIARALLKDPPILILDEATSALDAESEALVQQALERLVRGRTTFIIAHRLSTVVHADRILALRHGRIEESGTHSELMRRGGYYASLIEHQMRPLVLAME